MKLKINIQIKKIDFYDVVVKAMPVLQEKMSNDGNAICKIISVFSELPDDVIGIMLNAVSQEDKYEIVALLVRDNKEMLMQMLSQMLKDNDVDASLDELSLSNQMDLSIAVSNLNYAALAEKYLPLVHNSLIPDENPAMAMFAALLKLPAMLMYATLAKIPQNKKDEAVAYLMNKNKDKIIAKFEELCGKQGIHIRLDDLKVEV